MNRTDQLRQNGLSQRTPSEARDLLAANIGSDPYEKIEELRDIGARKARAEGQAYRLEHERKIVLAQLANEYASAHAKDALSEAKLDRLARADSRYQQHIAGLAAAIEERELARSEYWRVRTILEWDGRTVAHANAMSRLENP